jgi:hypothetical protein
MEYYMELTIWDWWDFEDDEEETEETLRSNRYV